VPPSASLGTWVLAWTLTAAIIVVGRTRSGVFGVGLVPAFVINFALGYWFSAAVDLLPWQPYYDRDVVAVGFRVSTYGLIAFGVGSLVVAPRLAGAAAAIRGRASFPTARLIRAYILLGLVSFLVLLPVVGRLPTAGALAFQGWNLLIVGLGLGWWRAWRSRNGSAAVLWLCATLCLPLLTVLTQGFLGYGTVASIAVLTFIGSFYRPRWRLAAASVLLLYLALSLYVTYIRDRDTIRGSVWGGDPIAARLQQLYTTVTTLEWFDLGNDEHLRRVDLRLNQNYLVGSAVQYMDAGLADYAYGRNLVDGMLSLIPRAIWPSKPFFAGSGNVVSQYTGLVFAEGTAVGIGTLLEVYISFGMAGVVVGFVLLGTLVAGVDAAAGRRLRDGDWFGFVRWFLPGLALLQVEGSMIELTSSMGAAFVVALLANVVVAGVATDAGATGGRLAEAAQPRTSRRAHLSSTSEAGQP